MIDPGCYLLIGFRENGSVSVIHFWGKEPDRAEREDAVHSQKAEGFHHLAVMRCTSVYQTLMTAEA